MNDPTIELIKQLMGAEEYARVHARSEATKRLKSDSDRAAEIVGAAFVEDELERCLKRHFITESVDHQDRAKCLLDPNGALGSFGVKIDLGWLMGIYSKNVKSNLKRIKNIRNAFAHKISVSSFDHEKIHNDCDKLNIAEKYLSEKDGIYSLTLQHSSGVGTVTTYEVGTDPCASRRDRYLFTCDFFVNMLANTYIQGRTHVPHF